MLCDGYVGFFFKKRRKAFEKNFLENNLKKINFKK
jgi:hypothetical protein